MKLDRRLFMGALAKLGVILGFPPALAAKKAGPALSEEVARRTFSAYLDTLIPDDEVSSGILKLGLDKAFYALAKSRPRYGAFITSGCVWLNQQAHKVGVSEFAALDEKQREAIVTLASEAPYRSQPRRFFESTRRSAFRIYYSRSDSWNMVGYDGPPQPNGFLDYTDPLRRRP
jgi:hypothetical protein